MVLQEGPLNMLEAIELNFRRVYISGSSTEDYKDVGTQDVTSDSCTSVHEPFRDNSSGVLRN